MAEELEQKDDPIIEQKKELISVMQEENSLLDVILKQQEIVHNCVRERNWDDLAKCMASLQSLSDDFAELEEKRTKLSEGINLSQDEEIAPVLSQVRGKLQKSKVENSVLNEFIMTTRKFLQGVFDSAVPASRNTLYSRDGKIRKPELQSMVLNKVV